MRYAHFEGDKLVSLGEGPVLPDNMVEITEQHYDELVAAYLRAVDPDPVATARRRVDDAYQAELDAVASGYPAWERESWLRQESEARSVLMSRPWINAAAEARGISASDLIDKIKAKADAFTLLHATATGKRQRLQDTITALGSNPSQADLDSIQW
jgi:hypothetical protein